MNARSAAVPLIILLATDPVTARGQGSVFLGRVMTDSGAVIPGAEVVLNGPQNSQRTNERGEFRFSGVRAGYQVVGVRMPGFAPRVDTIEVADAGEIRRDFRLSRIQATLPEVPVTATMLDRTLSEFYDRRHMGIGRFLDSAEFAKTHGTRTSDRLARLPGLLVLRGRGSEASVASTRQRLPGGRWCPSYVWLDYAPVGIGYNINLLDPSAIAAIEWYAGQAGTPARFNVPMTAATRYCGVLVIWTR